MAQSLLDKRRNLATNAVIQATRLLDAARALADLAGEQDNTPGFSFEQSDFDGTDLQHLTPGLIGYLLDFVVPQLDSELDVEISGGGGFPTRRSILEQIRK